MSNITWEKPAKAAKTKRASRKEIRLQTALLRNRYETRDARAARIAALYHKDDE